MLSREATLLCLSPLSPLGANFFPIRVAPISKTYLIQRSKQEFMQVNVLLFPQKEAGAGLGVGVRNV